MVNKGFFEGAILGALFSGAIVPITIIAAIFVIILIVIALILFLVLGLFAFIGLLFIGLSLFILIIKRGKVPINLQSPFIACLIIGICLILLGYGMSAVGMQTYDIDFRFIPYSKELNQFFTK